MRYNFFLYILVHLHNSINEAFALLQEYTSS